MMLTVEEYMAFRRLIDSERESEGATLASSSSTPAPVRRKVSAYNRKYRAAFKKVAPRFKLKSGKWKKTGFKMAVKAAHKMAGGKK
jgi:hypothetical protein